MAELLKPAGYSSAIVGKWHLGVGANGTYLPTNQGFDYYLVSSSLTPPSITLLHSLSFFILGYSIFTRFLSMFHLFCS